MGHFLLVPLAEMYAALVAGFSLAHADRHEDQAHHLQSVQGLGVQAGPAARCLLQAYILTASGAYSSFPASGTPSIFTLHALSSSNKVCSKEAPCRGTAWGQGSLLTCLLSSRSRML